MCDIHIHGIGYVCWDCKKEFEELLEKNMPGPLTAYHIERCLKQFMMTSKKQFSGGEGGDVEMNVGEYFRLHGIKRVDVQ